MRLYLSSFRLGNAAGRLRSLARGDRAVVIMNALDNIPDARRTLYNEQYKALGGLGFKVTACDLRRHFGHPEMLKDALEGVDLVWVNGGNSFLLSRAFSYSGFSAIIRERLEADTIAYGGFSAGAVIASHDLHGIEFLDAPDDVPSGYVRDVVWSGLNLIDSYLAVHFNDNLDDPIHKTIEDWKQRGMDYVELRDGDVLIVDGSRTEIVK